eukprot:12721483-Alexandrium_andersonii.AAC.1
MDRDARELRGPGLPGGGAPRGPRQDGAGERLAAQPGARYARETAGQAPLAGESRDAPFPLFVWHPK